MKLIDQLLGRAAAADEQMGRLAAQGNRSEARKKATKDLEHKLQGMTQDGVLDQEEMRELLAAYRAEGLDTSTLEELARQMGALDGVVGVKVDGDVRARLSDELREAGHQFEDPFFNFQAQQLVTEYNQSFDLASRVLKAEHEMYMAAVRNLKA